MSYIEQHLASNEQILRRAYISNAYVYGRPIFVLGLGSVIGFFAGASNRAPFSGLMIVDVLTFIFLGLPLLIGGLVRRATTEIALTNQRVILKWGLIRRHTIETYLDKIEGINANQGILGRLLGYGSLLVRGTGGGTNPCPGIQDPQAFRRNVNEEIQSHRFTAPQPRKI
jgi:uncharacterized membrane protein YdbT with pleckstrin-like domain